MRKPQPCILTAGLILLMVALPSGRAEPAPPATPIKPGQELALFPTYGCLDATTGDWICRVHGWLYKPQKGNLLSAGAQFSLRTLLGIKSKTPESQIFDERTGRFFVDNQDGAALELQFGDETVVAPATASNGHFEFELRLSAADEARLCKEQGCQRREITVTVRAPFADGRSWSQQVQLVQPSGISVISDIDDTMKISHSADKKALMQATFQKPFEVVPGMAALYQRWESIGAVFHFVSASPWQLYPDLSDYFAKQGFPAGSWNMKLFRLKDRTFFDLFDSPDDYKPPVICKLLEDFPGRSFLLVGDSGERDPEVYGDLARAHPGQVSRIYIRDVTNEPAGSERYQKAFQGLRPGTWQVFTDPSEIDFGRVKSE